MHYVSLSHLYEIRISIRAWLSVSAPCGLVFDVIVDKGTRPWNHRFRGRRCTATKSGCKDHDVSAGKENMENMSLIFFFLMVIILEITFHDYERVENKDSVK